MRSSDDAKARKAVFPTRCSPGPSGRPLRWLVGTLPVLAVLLVLKFASPAQPEDWVSLGPGGGKIRVIALALDPATPTTLYAGTYDGGVFKSTNGGDSWQAMNSGLTNIVVYHLAIDPSNPTTVYAGTVGNTVSLSGDCVCGCASNPGRTTITGHQLSAAPRCASKMCV